MIERWLPINGYEGLYEVSSNGKVKSLKKGIFLKTETLPSGYLRVYLTKNKNSRHFMVHRLVAEAFIPNPDNLPQVNHKDEVKTNNSVDNLEWCTAKYNNNYGNRKERMINTNVNKGVWNPDMVGLDKKTYMKIYRKEHKEEIREYNKKYNDSWDKKTYRKTYMKIYRENHREEIREYKRMWRKIHKEKINNEMD